MRSYDRDGRWSTSTVLVSLFLGFTIGFMACHKLYSAGGVGNELFSSRVNNKVN
jgi:hypothetical protein